MIREFRTQADVYYTGRRRSGFATIGPSERVGLRDRATAKEE